MAYELPELDAVSELPNHVKVWVDTLYGTVPETELERLYKAAKKHKTEAGNTYAVNAVDIEAAWRADHPTPTTPVKRTYDDPLYACQKCDFTEGFLHIQTIIGKKGDHAPLTYSGLLSNYLTIDGREKLLPIRCNHKNDYDMRTRYFVNYMDMENFERMRMPYDEYIKQFPDFDRRTR